jgi:2-phosphosulfolactate phosphatase
LLLATQATELLTGSFVNASALVNYIQKAPPAQVSLVSTSPKPSEAENEDIMLAYYIRDCLEGKEPSQLSIKEMLQKTSAYKYLFEEIGVPTTDFELCLDFNRFDFVIRQEIVAGRKVLVKHSL